LRNESHISTADSCSVVYFFPKRAINSGIMSENENLQDALNEQDLSTGGALTNAYEEDDDDEDVEPITAQKVNS